MIRYSAAALVTLGAFWLALRGHGMRDFGVAGYRDARIKAGLAAAVSAVAWIAAAFV